MMTEIRQRTWDFALTVITVLLLGSLGVQSFIGTLYSWWAQRTIPGWEQTGYAGFVQTMNALAAPQLVALIVVMGLCVPKRLFERRVLAGVSLAMLCAGVAVWAVFDSVAAALGAYLSLAALIQVAVVALTVAGARSPSYLTEGRLTKVGSGLLHLGFIMFCFVVAELQRSRFMLPAFALAALAILAGTALSFWAGRVAYGPTRPQPFAAVAEEPGPTGEDTEDLADDVLEVADHRSDEGGGELDELG